MSFPSNYILEAEKQLKAGCQGACPTRTPRALPPDEPQTADDLLRHAISILSERRANYGPPTEHFARTIGMVNAMLAHKLKEPLTIADWATMMMCDKMSRNQEKPITDNPVDVAGYAALWFECMKER